MGWKNLSYTKKGVMVALIATFTFAILGLLIKPLNLFFLGGFVLFSLFDELFLGGSFTSPSLVGPSLIFAYIFLSGAVYSLIGALIGWIVGKLKKK